MPAEIPTIGRVQAVGLDDHGHGVPAHIGAQPPLDFQIARAARLLRGLERIDVAGIGRKRHVHAVLARVFEQLFYQLVRVLRALAVDDGREGIHPFAGFLGVQCGGGGGHGAKSPQSMTASVARIAGR